MRVLSRIGLALILLSPLLVGPSAHAEDKEPRKILTGWIPYWNVESATASAVSNADLVNEVMPFWYTLKYSEKSKKARVVDQYKPSNKYVPKSVPLAKYRSANFQVIPTITDGTQKGVLASLLKNPTSRQQVIKVLMKLVLSKDASGKPYFDGIDIDFEGFAFVDGNASWTSTAPAWVAFIKELSVALRAEKKVLSVATPYVLDPAGKQKGYFVYAWAEIASSIDRLRIMTYDYSVAKVGPIGPISWAERTVQYAISIMPASKVFVGVPGYGRSWITAVNGVCPSEFEKSVRVGAKAATFLMMNADDLAATYGATQVYDEKFGEVTFNYQKVYNGTTAGELSTSCTASLTAWYQDSRSWAQRAALVKKYRIGGITAWTFGMEDSLTMPAVRALAREIAPDQVSAVATVDRTAIKYGKPVEVSAQFIVNGKSPLPNLPVTVRGKIPGQESWRVLSTAVTGLDGKIKKSILLGRSTLIQVTSEETLERTKGISPEILIEVARDLYVDAPTSIKAGSEFVITGSIRPRTSGAVIRIEKLSGKNWIPLEFPIEPTDSQGNFSVKISGQSRGIFAFRVTLLEDQSWKAVTSPTLNIIIR